MPSPMEASTSPPTSPTSSTSVSPSLLSFPSLGDSFTTRDELSTLIKTNGKKMGYIFKCSVTSEHRVTYYCSNKYHAPRCMAGFKAAFTKGSGWTITEAAVHNDPCTRARQRVNGPGVVKPYPDGDATLSATKVTFSSSASSTTSKNGSGSSKVKTSLSSSTHKKRPKSYTISSSSSAPSTVESSSTSSTTTGHTRKKRSHSSSVANSLPFSSHSGGYASTLRKHHQYRYSRDSIPEHRVEGEDGEGGEDEENDAPSMNTGAGGSRRRSYTYSAARSASKRDRSGSGSSSSSSSHSRTSSLGSSGGGTTSPGSTSAGMAMMMTTILDPAFHFPPASLEASIEIQKQIPLRRKRATSYIRNKNASPLLSLLTPLPPLPAHASSSTYSSSATQQDSMTSSALLGTYLENRELCANAEESRDQNMMDVEMSAVKLQDNNLGQQLQAMHVEQQAVA